MSADTIFLGLVLGLTLGMWVSTFLHELAHALVGKWVGFDVTSFGSGLAKPLLVFGWRGSRVYICASQPHGGHTFILSPPDHNPTKTQVFVFLFAGIAAHILIGLVCLVLWLCLDWGAWFWGTVGVLNALAAIENLVPFRRLHGLATGGSDGEKMLALLSGKGGGRSVQESIQRLHQFRKLWQDIGDRRMEADALHTAGSAWNILGDSEYAEQLKSEARTLNPQVVVKSEIDQLIEQGDVDRKAGRFDAAAEAYARAEQLWAAGKPDGPHLVILYCQAALAEARGQLEQADNLLNEIDNHPLISRSPYATRAAIYARLDILGKHLSADQLRDLQTKYDPLHSQGMVLEWDWLVYWNLVRYYAGREAWERGEEPAARACKAAETLWQGMPTPEDRQRFAKLASGFQQQAWDLLTRLGKHEQAGRISGLFWEEAEDTAAKEAAEQARREREDRRYRRGLVLAGLNLLVFLVGILACKLLAGTSAPSHLPWFYGSVLLLTFLQIPFLIGQVVVQPMYLFASARHRFSHGSVTCFFAAAPWFVASAMLIGLGVGSFALRYLPP